MSGSITRRHFAACLGAAAGWSAVTTMADEPEANTETQKNATTKTHARIYKSLKWNMIGGQLSTLEKFRLLQEIGFDGVELDSPGGVNKAEALAASSETGLPIDGTVDSTHWKVRLSDPEAARREQALADLLTALEETHQVGGHSVLLVPGHGQDGTKEVVYERSQEVIRRALPTAARLGVWILIENVWNEMFYDQQGDNGQTADELAAYVDALDSPWVGVQFDIGNHQKFGSPAGWIRTLGKRIVKLDVKDWGQQNGFCKLGEGDVDWPSVRTALADIGFTGWAAAEVAGGDRDQLADVSRRMDELLGIR